LFFFSFLLSTDCQDIFKRFDFEIGFIQDQVPRWLAGILFQFQKCLQPNIYYLAEVEKLIQGCIEEFFHPALSNKVCQVFLGLSTAFSI